MPIAKYLLSFLLIIFAVTGYSQSILYRIRGKVVDEQGKPLYPATISLLDDRQQTLQNIGTDTAGSFMLQFKTNSHVAVMVRFINYNSYQSVVFQGDKDLGIIQLKPVATNLKEVSVQARQNAIEMRGGNIIYNVDKSVTAQGMTALDLLKKMPGVDVDAETSIALNGKQGALIYLDGKQTYLSTREVIDLLKAMPSSQLKSVELIANPGAKYDAEGAAGIINLRTNKAIQKGLSATLSAGAAYGISAKQQVDANVTYRNDRLTVYGGYNHSLGNYNYIYGSDRLQAGTRFNSNTDDVDKRQRMNGRLGADYQLNSKSTIGILTTGNFVFGGGATDTRTQIINPQTGALQQTLSAYNDYYYQRTQRYNNNLNYRYEDKAGHQFSADVDLGRYKKSNGNLQDNVYSNSQDVVTKANLYRTLNDIDIDLFGAKADYTTNVLKGKLEAGAKYSEVSSGNNARFYHVLTNADSLDNRRSNNFSYKERIAAAYLNWNKKAGRATFDAGIRYENTNADGVLRYKTNNADAVENIVRKYGNIFPFLNITINGKGGNALSFGYAKRISRPAYQELNPFVYLLDELSFWQGNPFLQPQLTHRFSAQYALHSSTFITLAYSRTNNFSANVTDTLDQNKIVMVSKNLGVQNNLSLNLAQNLHPAPWLDLSLNGLVYYLHNDVNVNSFANLNLKQWAGRFNASATIKLPWSLTGELTGAYNTRRLGGANTITQANSRVDAGLQRTFNKKATLRLAVTDIYKGTQLYSTQNFAGFQYSNYGYFEARQVRLTFTYKILNGKVEGQNKRESALDRENERTGS